MKILLYCPTYFNGDGELALHQETNDSLTNLIIPDGVEVDVNIDAFNPFPVNGDRKKKHENTLQKYRMVRQKVLAEGYDALFTVEHDMVIPEDALVKMLNTDADVVYGLYMFRHLKPILNALRSTSGRWADMSVSNFPELVEKGKRQGWLEVSGAGFGCTLFHRRVLEKIDFHRANGGNPIPDMPFASDCIQNGFKQVCRFDVPCGHIKPDGKILHPFSKGGKGMSDMIKIYVYRNFNAQIDDRLRKFKEGEIDEIPEEYADEFIRAGFISKYSKPAVKVVNKPKSKAKKVVK